jgi:hypothetical protein
MRHRAHDQRRHRDFRRTFADREGRVGIIMAAVRTAPSLLAIADEMIE